MLRSKTTLGTLALAAIAALSLTALTPSLASPVKTGAVKTATARGKMTRGGTSTHIKVAKGTNTRGKEVHKKRAEVATVHIDNHTGWYIDCYVDGVYVGQAGPLGDLYPIVYSGSHEFYAVAHFTDGTQQVWGPSTYYVGSSFDWALTD